MRAILCAFRFYSAYSKAFSQSGSHAEGVKAGLSKIAEKPPFNVLSPDDIKRVVPVWSLIPDPRIIAKLVANNVRENNVAAMKDKRFLDQLARKYRQINKDDAKRLVIRH